MLEYLPDNPYLLLTPGPLSTTKRVKAAMLRDWCTWDADYNQLVQQVRERLARLATSDPGYTTVLVQGSGTFAVEAAVGSLLPPDGRLLVLANGAYGQRMAEIARRLRIPVAVQDSGEVAPPDLERLEKALADDPGITHVGVVHCETTTGILNAVGRIGAIVKGFGRTYLVDAMSSFAGIPFDAAALGADVLVSSANKCLQGVPGVAFVIARTALLAGAAGWARSLSLDLYDQWQEMEAKGGKWRFTSPTHVVRALAEALDELEAEGGVLARHARYRDNHRTLVEGMRGLGFASLLPDAWQSPIITSFLAPSDPGYDFARFYQALKAAGYVIYPGKVTNAETFRVGCIGDIRPEQILGLLDAVGAAMVWRTPPATARL